MNKRWLGIMTTLAGILLAGTGQSTVIYQDNFENGDLGNNDGIGGGMVNKTLQSHSWAESDGILKFNMAGTTYTRRAIAYSTNAWQSANGFTLVVEYKISSIVSLTANMMSFGLISADTDFATYAGYNIFGATNGVCSMGVNLTPNGNQGLNLATNGGDVVALHTTTAFVADTNVWTTVVISILPDGSGGADWSYSIGGVEQALGNIAVFDFTKSFRFAAYGQDDPYYRAINSVILIDGPIGAENLAPIASAQSVQVFPGIPKVINLMGSDPDDGPGSLAYSVVDMPAYGVLAGATNVWTYTPTAGYIGPDSFTFKVNDGALDSEPATVSVSVTNLAPTATAQSVQVWPGTSKQIVLAGSDPDNGPSSLVYSVVESPLYGVLAGATNVWTYTPNAGFVGLDSFTFKVNDGQADSAVATVSLAVTNYLPDATDQTVVVFPNTPTYITLTGSDPEGSNLTYSVVSLPNPGSLEGTPPVLTYTPPSGYQGPDSFMFKVNDGTVDSAPGTVSIVVTNYVPVANGQKLATPHGEPIAITLSGSDAEGATLTYAVVDFPDNGSLSGSGTTWSYAPNSGFYGVDTLSFSVNDGVQPSAPATVSITVLRAGTIVSFDDLSSAVSNNTLSVGGSTANIGVSGVLVPAGTYSNYLYSVTYAGADYDGDAVNDTLTFDVLVEAITDSIASTTFVGTDSDVNGYKGSAVIGTTNGTVTVNANGWAVGNAAMNPGETLKFTLQNMSVAMSQGAFAAQPALFTGAAYREPGNGYGHLPVVGNGAGGLFASRFNATQYDVSGLLIESSPLYITMADPGALPSANIANWNVLNVDFDIVVFSQGANPPSNISVGVVAGGSALSLSWQAQAGFTYGVEATDDLVYGTWSNIITGVQGVEGILSVTNSITANQQFFRPFAE